MLSGMELHAFDRQRAMADSHHDVTRCRRDLEACRHRRRIDHEAVIARRRQR